MCGPPLSSPRRWPADELTGGMTGPQTHVPMRTHSSRPSGQGLLGVKADMTLTKWRACQWYVLVASSAFIHHKYSTNLRTCLSGWTLSAAGPLGGGEGPRGPVAQLFPRHTPPSSSLNSSMFSFQISHETLSH